MIRCLLYQRDKRVRGGGPIVLKALLKTTDGELRPERFLFLTLIGTSVAIV